MVHTPPSPWASSTTSDKQEVKLELNDGIEVSCSLRVFRYFKIKP